MTNPPAHPDPPTVPDSSPHQLPDERGRSLWRIGEMLALFGILPIFYAVVISRPGLLFPALWVAAVLSTAALLLDRRRFDRRSLWLGPPGTADLGRELVRVLVRFVLLAGVLALAVVVYDARWNSGDALLLQLPRQKTVLWAIIMVGYPLASVYPQEVIWRPLFFHRYGPSLGVTGTVVASALSFGLVHILFGSWLSVALTAVGGLMFASTYARTGSTLLASVEHALYGCFAFTIGIGGLFYSG